MIFKYLKAFFDYKFILFILMNILFVDSYLLSIAFVVLGLWSSYFIYGTEDEGTLIQNIQWEIVIISLLFIFFVIKFGSLIIYYKKIYPNVRNLIIEKFFYYLKNSIKFKIIFIAIVAFITTIICNIIRTSVPLFLFLGIIPAYLVLFIYIWLEDKIRKIKGEKTFDELLEHYTNKS